ncbi:MAG: hypothetical protein EXX96DRAFT_522655 [Benjaminiella poitrasii]|nr:MAG: hypothetical protein EXX96DRAFT_522655 [Benjaminiella poitrasii]
MFRKAKKLSRKLRLKNRESDSSSSSSCSSRSSSSRSSFSDDYISDEERKQPIHQQSLPIISIDRVNTRENNTMTAVSDQEMMEDDSSSMENEEYKLSTQQHKDSSHLPSLSNNLELLLSLETQARMDAQAEREKEEERRALEQDKASAPRPTRIKFKLPVTPSRSRSPTRLAYPKARPIRSLPEEGLTANALRHPVSPKPAVKPRRAGWRYLFGDRKDEDEDMIPLPITLDSRVRLKMRPLPTFGYVRYIGGVDFGKGEYIGVELDHGVGNCDGSMKGKRYFDTDPNRGAFLKRHELETVSDD